MKLVKVPHLWLWSLLIIAMSISSILAYVFLWSSGKQISLLGEDVQSNPPKAAARCIVYDRPPRTGSTTIASALRLCLRKRGYQSLDPGPPRTWYDIMHRFVNLDSPIRASVGSHIHVTVDEMNQLQNVCSPLLYISSARPVAERILSAVKYESFPGHGKRDILLSVASDALNKTSDDELQKREYSLENYPYLRQPPVRYHPSNRVHEDQRMEPHYVIRDTHFISDLEALLDALGCERVDNLHANEHPIVDVRSSDVTLSTNLQASQYLLQKIKKITRLNDYRYYRLLEVADRHNIDGLRLARHIRSLDNSSFSLENVSTQVTDNRIVHSQLT